MKENKEVRIVERGSPDALLISKAMSSPTATELLDSLTASPKTATELEAETHYPLPTIQYHINNLLNANLIEVAGTRYSEKGRKMKIYAASETLLVISPKLTTADQIKPVLRRYGIPIAGVSAVSIAGLVIINRLLTGINPAAPVPLQATDATLFSNAAETTISSAPVTTSFAPAPAPSAAPLPETAETIHNAINDMSPFDALPLTKETDAAGSGTGAFEQVSDVVTAAGDVAAATGDGTALILSGVQTGLLIFFIAAVAALLGMMIFEIVRIKKSGGRKKN